MPVVSRRRGAPARRGCDEECLRRIAMRLCTLDCGLNEISGPSSTPSETTDDCATSTGCCKPKATPAPVKDSCCASSGLCGPETTTEVQTMASGANKYEPGCCGTGSAEVACRTASLKDECASTRAKQAEEGSCCPTDPCCAEEQAVGTKVTDTSEVEDCCAGSTCTAAMKSPDSELSNTRTRTDNTECAIETATQDRSCESGCCSTEKTVAIIVQDRGNCTDSCCEPKGDSCCEAKEDSCCEAKEDSCCEAKEDSCCEAKEDSCCKPKTTACNAMKAESAAPKADDCSGGCCEPKETVASSGCADECCIDEKKVLVNVECAESCCTLPEKRTASAMSACSKHLQDAFDRYEAMLSKGRCLCRKALEQFGVSCCTLGPNGMVEQAASTSRATPWEKADVSIDVQPKTCDGDQLSIHQRCSRELQTFDKTRLSTSKARITKKNDDVEHDAAREHVVLKVSGMTCTGCVRKMTNVLDRVPGLSNSKVAFVSESTEFDLDSNIASLDEVLSQVEKETGFKLSRIVSGYQHLDLLMPPDTAKRYLDQCPDGVVSFTKQKDKSYRLTYNPRVVGARSLLLPNATLAPPAPDFSVTEGKRRLRNMLLSFLVTAVLTIPVVVLGWSDNPVPETTRQIVSLVLATIVQAVAVPEFYVGALKSLIYSRVIEMDMLVVISITAAYGYSVVAFGLTEAGYQLEQEAFFETSSLLITLVLFGRLMSSFARVRAVSAVSLRSLQAETALLLHEDGSTGPIDARLLEFGDKIKIAAHSRVVTDGDVIKGETAVDESMVTGESMPVRKQAGDSVIAGTLNGSGSIDIKLTRLPGENSITDIADLVQNAIGAKPRIQDIADKVASYFIPAVIVISLIVFAIWIAVALEIRQRNAGGAVGTAITYGIAVLAVSCPCALGLAVPMVLVIGCGVAAKLGVIIKAADAIERGFKATDVVFDKTGTLTNGDLQVVHEQLDIGSLDSEQVVALAKALVKDNDHPVSAAISLHLQKHTKSSVTLDKLQSIPGAGVQAMWKGSSVKAGNPYWLGLEQHPVMASLLQQGMTLLCLTHNGELLAVWGLRSTLRTEASAVVAELQRRQITCHIVSGDAPRVVEEIAQTLNIAPEHALARRSPAEKQKYVQDLQASGKKVVFCGDGTNDAVAVAQADVGMQIGSASDVTSAVADVVLLGGLDGVITLIDVSRRAFRRIRFNFVWTVVYNLFAILLAAGAFVRVRIPPAYAGLGEIVSVAPVILAAMSLAWGKKRVLV